MDQHAPETLDLREYLQVVQRRKWTIIQTLVIVLAAATIVSVLQTPRYTTSSRLIIEPATGVGQDAALVNLLYGNRELETQRELVTTLPVADRVASSLDLPEGSGRSLLGAVRVRVVGTTSILEITAESSDAAFAARLADGFALGYLDFRRSEELLRASETGAVIDDLVAQKQQRLRQLDRDLLTAGESEAEGLGRERQNLLDEVARLNSQRDSLASTASSAGLGGRIVVPAAVPSKPTSPNLSRAILLAAVLGLALGVGLAFVRDRLDDVIRSEEETARIVGAPVLGRIPTWTPPGEPTAPRRLVSLLEPSSVVAEAYRTLRTNVRFLNVSGSAGSLLVTSPLEGEGKTVTASNLAVAMSRAGSRVLLVGADLRRPTVHRLFGLDAGPGLSDVLARDVELLDVVTDVGVPNLRVVPSGHIPPNPSELLGSGAMLRLMEELSALADFVIYDGPPVLAVADALELSPRVASTLLVVDQGKTGRHALRDATTRLQGVGGRVAGTVINNVEPSGAYYQYRYYGESPSARTT